MAEAVHVIANLCYACGSILFLAGTLINMFAR
jgi:hypothetical protein